MSIRFFSLDADASSASNFLMQHTSHFALALLFALTLLFALLLFALTLLIALTLLMALTLLIALTLLFALTSLFVLTLLSTLNIYPLSFVQSPNYSGMRSATAFFSGR
ncbi:hypothetical protein [Paenibacillus thiaminolyticus]|uniref:Uncharacterized protein n=1 Tax=Paenibacillus thiaminolyticus TaxID=49283 RepID=A0A3A3GPW2_PANTH|nr:hypothetical protein [Paenibacillus thiaminolyticus]RJG26601.1 hypothetical protein DQX05_00760 [Paenibacillus thiaminolyticus]